MKFTKRMKKWCGKKRRAAGSFAKANLSWAGSYLSVETLKKRNWSSALILKIARNTVDRNENDKDYQSCIGVQYAGEIDTNQFLSRNSHPVCPTPRCEPKEVIVSGKGCPANCEKDGITTTRGIPAKNNQKIVPEPAVVPPKPTTEAKEASENA
jgi:hypothetical protein